MITVFWELLIHKLYVMWYGWELGVPIKRLLIHDLYRFRPSYLRAEYRYMHQGDDGGMADYVEETTLVAQIEPYMWLHYLLPIQEEEHAHIRRLIPWVDEHPHVLQEYFVAHPMPGMYASELVADWLALHKQRHVGGTVKDWYIQQRPSMILHPKTEERLNYILGVSNDELLEKRTRAVGS